MLPPCLGGIVGCGPGHDFKKIANAARRTTTCYFVKHATGVTPSCNGSHDGIKTMNTALYSRKYDALARCDGAR